MPVRGASALRALVGLACVSLLSLLAASAQAQKPPERIRFTTRALQVAVNGRLQTLFSTTTADEVPLTQWEIRRARLELALQATPLVRGRLQAEFSGGTPLLRDAYLTLHLSPALQILAGRAMRPFSQIQQSSSVTMPLIERGAVIRGIAVPALDHYNLLRTLGYLDRDTGIQFLGSTPARPWSLSYAVALTNGPLQARVGDRSAYQLGARLRLQTGERLRLGASWSRRDFLDLREEEGRVLQLRSGQAWEADIEYGSFAPGLHLLGEVAIGDADPYLGSRFTAAQLWVAHRTRPLSDRVAHLEPTLRVSHAQHDPLLIRGLGGTLLTPGINLYFDPLNRVMLNYDLWFPRGDRPRESSVKLMFQLAF